MSKTSAYIVGVALGDGNLSCPNGKAIRLRVTCDTKYPNLILEIKQALIMLFPKNKVSIVKNKKGSCIDISVYSNQLEGLIPWKVGYGSKILQQAHVPKWVIDNTDFTKACLKGLMQTDGSIYIDRSYLMVNFTNLIKPLIDDVYLMMQNLKFQPKIYQSKQRNGNIKYVVRLSKNVSKFMNEIELTKS